MRWFRFYHEALDDPKVQRLPGELFKFWVNVLSVASRNDPRGQLPPLEDVAFQLRMDEGETLAQLEELQRRGLIEAADDGTLEPHNWQQRQPASDNVTERVRKHREKQADDVTGNVTGTFKRRGDKSRREETSSPAAPQETEVPERAVPSVPKPKQQRPRDPYFDHMVAALELNPERMTEPERGRLNKAIKQIREAGGQPEEIPRAVSNYQSLYANADCTPTAIAANWSRVVTGNGKVRSKTAEEVWGRLI